MITVHMWHDVLIRKASLAERNVSRESLLKVAGWNKIRHEDDDLITIPARWPGVEGLEDTVRDLQRLGLEYWDDFVEVKGDFPDWCGLSAHYQDELPTIE